jgi:predicted ribosome quality control (RQC) complex YloA/Tae2 family protein
VNEISSLFFYDFVVWFKKGWLNSYVDKVMHSDKIIIKIKHERESSYLCIVPQVGAFLDDSLNVPQNMDSIASLFRKYLSGSVIIDVWQYNFDRIIVFEFKKNESLYRVVFEGFRTGSIVLLEGWNILWADIQRTWKDRKIFSGEEYKFPPSKTNPIVLTLDQLIEKASSFDSTLWKFLNSHLALGKEVSEYIITTLGFDGKKDLKHYTEKDLKKIYELWRKILDSANNSPDVYYNALGDIDFFDKHGNTWIKENILRIIGKREEIINAKNKEQALREENDKKIEEMKHLQQQITKLNNEIDKANESVQLIYNHYSELMDIISLFDNGNEREIANKLIESNKIVSYNGKDHIIALNADNKIIELYINNKIEYTIGQIYNLIKGHKTEIGKIEEELKIRKEKNDVIKIKEPPLRKRKWYEKYHWFYTSAGYLVISGKSAKDNDYIVKKYMKDNDLFFHADIHGASITLLKSGTRTVNDKDLYETAQFAISYSKAWNAGHAAGDVYWVYPDQVSKTPSSGEFVPRGSWIINGKKNYIHGIPLALGLVYENIEGLRQLVCVPLSKIQDKKEKFIAIYPGNIDRMSFAKKLASKLKRNIDDILPLLPPGNLTFDKDLNSFEF